MAIRGPDVPPGLPRLFVLDELYRQAILGADLVTDLDKGGLTWSREFLDEVAARFTQEE